MHGYGTANSYGGGAQTQSYNGETLTIAKMVSGNGRTRLYGLSRNGGTGSENVIGWFEESQFTGGGSAPASAPAQAQSTPSASAPKSAQPTPPAPESKPPAPVAETSNNPVSQNVVIDNTLEGHLSIPAWVVGAALDVAFTLLNTAMQAGFIGVSTTIKVLASNPLTRKTAINLMNKKIIPCFIYGFLNPVMTAIRPVITRITGVAITFLNSYAIDKFTSFLNNNAITIISSLSTWGGIFSLSLDYISDWKLDGKIVIY